MLVARGRAAICSTLVTRRPHRLAPPALERISRGCMVESVPTTTTATTGQAFRKHYSDFNNATLKRKPSAIAQRLPDPDSVVPHHRFREFELDGRTFIVTGGAGGLGLVLAEALVEAGGHVYCLDRAEQPPQDFWDTKEKLAHHFQGTLEYERVDVTNVSNLDKVVGRIADHHGRLDGLVAAAAIQNIKPALEWTPEEVSQMMLVNFNGVFHSAVSCAKQMIKHSSPGSMVLIGSMSGIIANKYFDSSVYNAGKAAVIQLGKNLSMEWRDAVNQKPIRVNVLCPGNIMTPMVKKNIADEPRLKKLWESENMFGRLSIPEEYRGATLYMLSDASSFMTGSKMVVDGGYTAW